MIPIQDIPAQPHDVIPLFYELLWGGLTTVTSVLFYTLMRQAIGRTKDAKETLASERAEWKEREMYLRKELDECQGRHGHGKNDTA